MSRSHFRMFQLSTLLASLACLALAGPVRATVIAYESFTYDPGTVTGLNGGTGWGGAWTTSGALGDVIGTGLTYTDSMGNPLQVEGGSAVFSAPTGTANSQYFRLMSANIGETGGVTTWWSFIGQRLSPHPTADENLARAASLQLSSTTASERLAVGKGTTTIASPPVPTGWAMLHTGNAANSVYTTKPQLEQSFLVVRVDHVGDTTVADNAWIWVNPRLDVEPDINAADQSLPGSLGTSADFTFNRIRAFAGAAAATGPYASLALDEIRFGTTFADVAPIAGATLDTSFDADTDTDGDDFLIWQRGLGITTGATNSQGDSDGDGDVDGTDLANWRTRYGSLTSVPAAESVPEPAAFGLAVIALLGLAASRRRSA